MNAHDWNDEYRSTIASYNEADRYTACSHSWSGNQCVHCGERIVL